jgi:hypothetical protein
MATSKGIGFGSVDELLDAICEKLQLSSTEYQLAKQRYEGIGTYLDRHELLSPFRPRVYPQGSVALGTTVRPKGRQEHDIDLVCELQIEPAAVPNPVAVLDLVQQSIQGNEVYRRITERKNRCIRLNYVGKFHLDILPACPDRSSGGTCVVVPDCRAQAWKATNPEGYAAWFQSSCEVSATTILARAANLPRPEAVADKPPLKLAVQLAKRARDVQFSSNTDLAPRSIILTTLFAIHYSGEESTFQAVDNILSGILRSLPATGRLVVLNPMNAQEDFSETWREQRLYFAFLSFVREFSASWATLRTASGIQSVKAILEKLFGEDITSNVVQDLVKRLNEARAGSSLGITGAGMLTHSPAPMVSSVPGHTYHGR